MTKEEITIKAKAIMLDKLAVNESEITLDANFITDLSADSLDRVELIMELEKEFDIRILDQDAEKIFTVGQAIDCIEEHLKNKN